MPRHLKALLLATTALFSLPASASAGPLNAALIITQKYFASVFGSQLGAFFYNLAGSALLSVAANALASSRTARTTDVKRELALPNSRPPYRYVYGHYRMTGSPLPVRVKDTILYLGLLLNSRPSAGTNLRIYIDRRPADIEVGDIYDFSGSGAVLSIEGFTPIDSPTSLRNPRAWLQLGDETAPPQTFIDEAPEFFTASDGWRGRTVLWLRMDAGPSEQRTERWPRVPPDIEVAMDYSRVYDPRIPSQDADDPTTWTFSANHALCTLDALRTNPIKRYPLSMLDLTTWRQSADIADEPVPLKAGGTEPRYETNGFIAFSGSEILDQLAPMELAGAGSFVRIGGLLGYAPGAYADPVTTITDIVEDGGIDLQTLVPGRDLPSAVRASYIAPDRDWQQAELPQIAVPGAEAGDSDVLEISLPFVTSPTQAARIQQIRARQLEAQRTLACVLWPDALRIVGGSTLIMDLPTPFRRVNGLWRVLSADPSLWTGEDGEGGVAMRIPVTLQKTGPHIYEWNPDTDELDIETVPYDPVRPLTVDPDLPLPLSISVESIDDTTIDVTAVMADTTFVDGLEILVSETSSFAAATPLVSGFVGPGQPYVYSHTGLPTGSLRYYWARSIAFPNSRSLPVEPVSTAAGWPFTGGVWDDTENWVDGAVWNDT